MKVVLLKDVSGVGRKHDVKEVSDGYARNFLIPRQFAAFATKNAESQASSLRAKSEGERAVQENLFRKNVEGLKEIRLVMKDKANEQGHLFAGIQADEISQALKEQTGIEINSSHILLPKALKEIGEYKIPVSAHGVEGQFTLSVEAL